MNPGDDILKKLSGMLRKLNGRRDAGAEFARSRLKEWEADVQARSDAYEAALPGFETACAAHKLAVAEMETKRAELLAELERAFAPFAQRELEARQALEAKRGPLPPSSPVPLSYGRGVLDTEKIAARASKPEDPEEAYLMSDQDLARARARAACGESEVLTAAEMFHAILAEGDFPGAPQRAAFDQRWRYFAHANGLK